MIIVRECTGREEKGFCRIKKWTSPFVPFGKRKHHATTIPSRLLRPATGLIGDGGVPPLPVRDSLVGSFDLDCLCANDQLLKVYI